MSIGIQSCFDRVSYCLCKPINNIRQGIATYNQEISTRQKILDIIASIFSGLVTYFLAVITNTIMPFGISHLQGGIVSMLTTFVTRIMGFRCN